MPTTPWTSSSSCPTARIPVSRATTGWLMERVSHSAIAVASKSAMANAEDKGVRNSGDLVVTDARGDGGPMFKRLMPRARGMAYLVRRRSAHIVIGLYDPLKPVPEAGRRAGHGQARPQALGCVCRA